MIIENVDFNFAPETKLKIIILVKNIRKYFYRIIRKVKKLFLLNLFTKIYKNLSIFTNLEFWDK
ncbi:unnamed protein product [marine sediment metagenome]|uniref:Uncharacterized protein n=1 Tax=marine sediment metagenome TaxID=412755 RepID=X1HDV8_9ZZZZ